MQPTTECAVPIAQFRCSGVVFRCGFRGKLELDRRDADHIQVGAAFGATQLVAASDVEFVNVELSVTAGADRHSRIKRGKL